MLYWLPVVGEVRTKIYGLSRKNLLPSLYMIEYFDLVLILFQILPLSADIPTGRKIGDDSLWS